MAGELMPLLQCQLRPPEAHTSHQFDGDMEVCAAIGVSFLRDDDELKQNAVATATEGKLIGTGESTEGKQKKWRRFPTTI